MALFDFESMGEKLDRFLYRRVFKQLSRSDLQAAEKWALAVIRRNHPDWDEEQVRQYYDSLLKIKVTVCDDAGRPVR
ncbi:MAG: hypothetical protein AAGK14_13295 [Verrucomicrobiota bacterium]